MSKRTNEINKVTGTIISVSVKLIIYALILFVLYQGVSKGYTFGYEIFNPSAMAAEPGVDKTVEIKGDSVKDAAKVLKNNGLISNELIFEIQAKFYDYGIHPGVYTLNTSETSKDMLKILDEEPETEDKEEKS